jgi:hypothetical protein
VIDFLKVLFTSPMALPWMLLIGACLVLLLFGYVIAYLVAFAHAHLGKSWRELLVTTTRSRVSWIWGWTASCIVLLLYVAGLAYLERIASWLAALPFLVTAVLTLCIAFWLRHSVRTRVVRLQNLVQGGRP